jgi:hypothetical protein
LSRSSSPIVHSIVRLTFFVRRSRRRPFDLARGDRCKVLPTKSVTGMQYATRLWRGSVASLELVSKAQESRDNLDEGALPS